MASLLFTIGGAVVNAGLILYSVDSQTMEKKNAKDMIWRLKSFKWQGTNGIKIE